MGFPLAAGWALVCVFRRLAAAVSWLAEPGQRETPGRGVVGSGRGRLAGDMVRLWGMLRLRPLAACMVLSRH